MSEPYSDEERTLKGNSEERPWRSMADPCICNADAADIAEMGHLDHCPYWQPLTLVDRSDDTGLPTA